MARKRTPVSKVAWREDRKEPSADGKVLIEETRKNSNARQEALSGGCGQMPRCARSPHLSDFLS
jgi:hypothetical protein